MEKDLSVIMTALNEEDNITDAITSTLAGFDNFKINGEIVVVNDGSTDKTPNIVNNFSGKDRRVRMVSHLRPQGVGASFWDGVDIAEGRIVTWMPADNENDPAEILRYFKLTESFDIVIPYVINKEVRSRTRNTISSLYLFIINLTFRTRFRYTNGTNLYRRSMLKTLASRTKGFLFHTDILIRAVKKGYRFTEVPYKLGARKTGRSKAFTLKSLLNTAQGYLRLVWAYYFKGE